MNTILAILALSFSFAHSPAPTKFAPKVLYRGPLKGAPNKEVLITVVDLPAGAQSPLHKHPGEEFAYVIEGKAVQKIGDKPEETISAGSSAQIPYGIPHYVRAEGGPLKAVVFRVHEVGQPEMTIVEEPKKKIVETK